MTESQYQVCVESQAERIMPRPQDSFTVSFGCLFFFLLFKDYKPLFLINWTIGVSIIITTVKVYSFKCVVPHIVYIWLIPAMIQ